MANVSKAITTEMILNSLHEGLYVCDTERQILYWSRAAERITGWLAKDVVGRRCLDNLLVHVDKDGRPLCGEEFCPLHRSMQTDKSSAAPLIVFGQTSDGGRLPMAVSVAPLHDDQGVVIGGIETFHDFSETYRNLKRAKTIQTLAMESALPTDSRLAFATHYLPHDMIGGDYYAIRQLDSGRYGFMLADVMGHGVAAALYTMHLSSLWSRHWQALAQPAEFARQLNAELCKIVRDESFATAICGVVDPASRMVRFASAGGPPLLLFRPDRTTALIEASGWPFGVADDASYEENEFQCAAGDCLLLFSDGAIEIYNARGEMLGSDGLTGILRGLSYPQQPLPITALHEALLTYSNDIRLDDDLTFLEMRFS